MSPHIRKYKITPIKSFAVCPTRSAPLKNNRFSNHRMDSATGIGISSGSIALLGLLYTIWLRVQGHRLVSDCCGKKYEVGVEVKDMPPTPQDSPEIDKDLTQPLVVCVESPPESSRKLRREKKGKGKGLTALKHQTPLSEEEETVPSLTALTTSEPTPFDDRINHHYNSQSFSHHLS